MKRSCGGPSLRLFLMFAVGLVAAPDDAALSDEGEGLYDDESVKYSEDDDKRDDSNREVNEEINSTVSNHLK